MRVKPTLFSHGPQRVFSACFYKRIIPFPLLSSKAVDSFLPSLTLSYIRQINVFLPSQSSEKLMILSKIRPDA
jgi:hypothetical protein